MKISTGVLGNEFGTVENTKGVHFALGGFFDNLIFEMKSIDRKKHLLHLISLYHKQIENRGRHHQSDKIIQVEFSYLELRASHPINFYMYPEYLRFIPISIYKKVAK